MPYKVVNNTEGRMKEHANSSVRSFVVLSHLKNYSGATLRQFLAVKEQSL